MFLPTPGFDALWLLLICLFCGISLIGLGLPFTTPQTRVFAPWAGWGLLSALLVVWGAVFYLPLSWLLIPLLLVGFGWAFWNIKRLNWWLYPLLAALMILLFGAMADVVMWDDYSHRLGSVFYLYDQDAFPQQGLPASFSGFPAYPYGLSFIGQAASLLSGAYQETALAVFGGIQFVFLAALVMFLWQPPGLQKLGTQKLDFQPLNFQNLRPLFALFMAAGAVAFTTWGNPLFVPKLVFSGYNDVPLGLFMAAALVVTARLNHDLYAQEKPWAHALLLAAIGCGVMMQKQLGIVLFGLLGLALLWPHIWRQTWRQRNFWLVGLLAGGIPLALALLWRWYISVEIPAGEFTARGIAQWHLDKLPDILYGMGLNIWHAPGLFIPQFMVVGLAAYSWRRPYQTPYLQESIRLAAWLAIGYNLILFTAYATSFSAYEAVRAASYDRYNMHVSYACWVVVLFAAGAGFKHHVQRWPYALGALACLLAWGLPVVFAERTLIQAAPDIKKVRLLAAQLRSYVNDNERVLTYAPYDSGYIPVIVRYELRYKGNQAMNLHHFAPLPAEYNSVRDFIAQNQRDRLIVLQQDERIRQEFPQLVPGQITVLDVRNIR